MRALQAPLLAQHVERALAQVLPSALACDRAWADNAIGA